MNILGLSAFYHDSSCCLLADGRLVAAASEERFSRRKHDRRLPVAAARYCLDAAGIGLDGLDLVAYYEDPVAKLSRQLWSGARRDGDELGWLDPGRPERAIREGLGWDGPLETFGHHRSHAASAFLFGPFDTAAVLTVDGVGEWATASYGRGRGASLETLAEVDFPHSLGLFYSALTAYLGFAVNDGEGKLMGLAPAGQPRFAGALESLLRLEPDGRLVLDLEYFDFIRGGRMFAHRLGDLLGAPPRRPGAELTDFHRDVAASVQRVFEERLLGMARHLADRVAATDLCLAGGAALNCVANARLRREGPFARIWVQPAAGDAGGALGAAALAWAALTGRRPEPLEHVFLGPSWGPDEIARTIEAAGLPAEDHRGREDDLLAAVAERLAAGQIVGWFQGRMEFGPRALGARSLLASPFDPSLAERLNRAVKRREAFRPFAPAVLRAAATDWFGLAGEQPFMLETCAVKSSRLPAVTHVDGSARVQTVDPETHPRFAALLAAFGRRTGCPVLLNTSLNVAGAPIVCTPVDALCCLADAEMDALVLEDHLLERARLPAELPLLAPYWRPAGAGEFGDLYAFV